MSAEFIATMGDGSGMYQIFEFDVTRHVVGDAETVRAGLVDALEQLGYRMLNDTPIQARRITPGGAGCEFSSDVLDYQTTLNIGLKSVGINSTRIVFDYQVKGTAGGWLSNGDRKTLTREAEAIIATAMTRAAGTHCSACGSDTAGSSRFCRKCGAPLIAPAPAETEVLRLTAKTNAAQKNLGFGLLFLMLGAAMLLILPFGSADPIKFAKLVKIFGFLSTAFGGTGLLMMIYSWFKLRQLVSQPIEKDSLLTPPRRNFVEGVQVPNTNELPPASIQHPVTEATTDLLHHEIKRASIG